MKKFLLFLITAFIIASCTITEKVVFNSKNGGDISYELDCSQFAAFMASTDTTGETMNFSDSLLALGSSTESLKNINGIKNVKYTSVDNKLTISFSFDNIEALNKAHMELGKQTESIKPGTTYEKVSVKNKKEWVYRTWPLADSPTDSIYSTMGMMLTYNVDATFPKEVVSVEGKNITKQGNRITWTSSDEDNGASYAFDGIKVKLK